MYGYNELNKSIAHLFNSGVHTMSIGSDIVSDVGIAAINTMLLDVGLPMIPENIGSELIGQAVQRGGIDPLTLGENVVLANNGDLTSVDGTGTTLAQRLGIIQAKTSTPAQKVIFDITRKFDWKNGSTSFRYSSSCWWTTDYGNNRYRDSTSLGTEWGNGFAIRLFVHKDNMPQEMKSKNKTWDYWHGGDYIDRGRIWVIPMKYGYLLFNAYDRVGKYNDPQYAELLATILAEAVGGSWVHRSVEVSGANGMYINDGEGEYLCLAENLSKVGSTVILSKMIQELRSTIQCSGCKERFPHAFWHEAYNTKSSGFKCEECVGETVSEAGLSEKRVSNNPMLNAHNFGFPVPSTLDGQWAKCAVTGRAGLVDQNMIWLSGIERITDDGSETDEVYGKDDWCLTSIFNYYFTVDPDVKNVGIRRRLENEVYIQRQPLSNVIYGEVGKLKDIYGRRVGKIQKGLTIKPVKALPHYQTNDLYAVLKKMAMSNQLWNSIGWMNELLGD